MNNGRRQEIRRAWRITLAYLLEEDAGGGELLKEAWEQCETEEDNQLIRSELLVLADQLRQEALAAKFIPLPKEHEDDTTL